MINVQRYIGIPWLDGGRSFSGCECWGLVEIVLKNEFGIEIPCQYPQNFSDIRDTVKNIRAAIDNDPWVKVCTPAYGDVVAMGRGSHIHHVGVYVPGGCLHCIGGIGTVLTSLRGLKKYGFKKMEYYRWPQ